MNSDHKYALKALDENGILSAALDALKEKLIRASFNTDPHESKKREEYYLQYRLIGSLKEVVRQAVNDVGDKH